MTTEAWLQVSVFANVILGFVSFFVLLAYYQKVKYSKELMKSLAFKREQIYNISVHAQEILDITIQQPPDDSFL